jgi:hypothetical protein
MSSPFSSYMDKRHEGVHWKAAAAVAGGISILAVAGFLLWWRASHGLKAVHSGMNKDQVVAALGKPSYVYKCEPNWCNTVHVDEPPEQTYTSHNSTWPRICLLYKLGPKRVMTVEFDAKGIIYERNVLEIEGPEEDGDAYQLAAFGVTSVGLGHPAHVFAFPVPPCAAAIFTWEAAAPKPLRAYDIGVAALDSLPLWKPDRMCGGPLNLLAHPPGITVEADKGFNLDITAVETTNPHRWIRLEDVDALAGSGREDFTVVEHYPY